MIQKEPASTAFKYTQKKGEHSIHSQNNLILHSFTCSLCEVPNGGVLEHDLLRSLKEGGGQSVVSRRQVLERDALIFSVELKGERLLFGVEYDGHFVPGLVRGMTF